MNDLMDLELDYKHQDLKPMIATQAQAPPTSNKFTLKNSISQQENRALVLNPSAGAFRPHRGNGQTNTHGHTGAQPIFPGLRRLQQNNGHSGATTKTTNISMNMNGNQQQPAQQRPFFSLLNVSKPTNPSTTAPVSEPFRIMKHEPASSDKAFSPSPPPVETHISSIQSNNVGGGSGHRSSIGIGIGISVPRTSHHNNSNVQLPHPQPYQMLPPPPPPQGPDSRPSSPARPRPSSRARSRTRSSSSMSMGFRHGHGEGVLDGEGGGEGTEDILSSGMGMDVDAVAINALRSVRAANVELSEERRRNKTLLAQLSSLTSSHDALKQEHSTLSQTLHAKLEELAKVKDEVNVIGGERDNALTKRGEESGKVETLRKGMQELGESYASLKTAFTELKEQYGKEQKLAEELRNAKALASESLKKLEPLLQDDTYLAKEARNMVLGLQDDLADSRRVIDLLRDKLHHLSTTLAESQNRVRELECGERESKEEVKVFLERVKREGEERVAFFEGRMKEMGNELEELRECRNAKKVLELRLEDLGRALKELEDKHASTASTLENTRAEKVELQLGNQRLMKNLDETETKMREELSRSGEEMSAMKKACEDAEESRRQIETQMALLQERFSAQTLTLRLTKEQYVDVQERLQGSESALVKVRDEVEALRGQMVRRDEELRKKETEWIELLRTSEETLAKTCQALEEKRTEVERMASEALNKAEEFRQLEVRLMEDKRMEVEKMAGQAFLKAEEFRQLEVRMVAIQERCAVLTEEGTKRLEEFKETTLNLRKQNETQNKKLEQAQTRYTALEEKMREALKDKVDEIEAVKRGGNEELHKAEVQVAALQEKLKAQEAALHLTQGRYGDLQKASATLADELTTAQNSLDEARQEMLKRAQDSLRLMKLCERIEKDQARAEEERLQREKERSMGEDEKVLELKLLVERLQSEKGTLEQRSATLRARYDRNELNDDEKTFAEWLMGLARSLHDEEDVVKDNELRRKDNLVQQHLTKIRQLESGLAHLIKEKEEFSGGTNKSMIDLNAFMTSSPSPCTSPCTSDIASAPPPAPPAPVKAIPPVANSAVPPAPASAPVVPKVKLTPIVTKATKPPTPRKTIGLSFSSLDESDSEEDIPLSEVSAAAKSKSVLGKRERVPSPVKPQPEIVNAITTANMTANPRTYGGSRRLRNAGASQDQSVQLASVATKKAAGGASKAKRKRR